MEPISAFEQGGCCSRTMIGLVKRSAHTDQLTEVDYSAIDIALNLTKYNFHLYGKMHTFLLFAHKLVQGNSNVNTLYWPFFKIKTKVINIFNYLYVIGLSFVIEKLILP